MANSLARNLLFSDLFFFSVSIQIGVWITLLAGFHNFPCDTVGPSTRSVDLFYAHRATKPKANEEHNPFQIINIGVMSPLWMESEWRRLRPELNPRFAKISFVQLDGSGFAGDPRGYRRPQNVKSCIFTRQASCDSFRITCGIFRQVLAKQ